MSEPVRDGNDVQRERSTLRMRDLATEEIARALEQVGVDIRTADGRRSLRVRLDYLDEIYEGQEARRAERDWTRYLMGLMPPAVDRLQWVAGKMEAEKATRDAVRKTVVEKLTGGLVWLLLGSGATAAAFSILTKGHGP